MNAVAGQVSFFDPAVIADPFAYYQNALAHDPVHEVAPGMFVVFSYDLCCDALARTDVFSNNFQGTLSGALSEDAEIKAIISQGWPQVDTLLTADPPVHTRFRKLVNLAFSAKRVAAIEADIRAVAIRLIDRMAERGAVDFVTDFAIPLPVAMISGQIGIEEADRKSVV